MFLTQNHCVCAGKTVVLLLQGLRWLRSGNDVFVVSWRSEARAASVMLAHQLRLANPATAGQVKPVHLDSEAQARTFAGQIQGTKTFVLVDEADFKTGLVSWMICS